MAVREASTEPDDKSTPTDAIGSAIEVDEADSGDVVTNGDVGGDEEPNEIASSPRSGEIITVE